MATFTSSLKSKLIYVFAIDDERHRDCLKIGETTLDEDDGGDLSPNSDLLNQAAHKRILQYTKTAGIAYQLLYTEDTIFRRSGMILSFNDKQVHKVLERSGIPKKEFAGVKGADEWYCCDLETVKKAIKAVKKGESSLHASDITQGQTPIIFRPEQREAIDRTRTRFKKGNQMLWNAKMRFGKTLSALQVVKEEEFVRTLILTHRPVVDKGWFEDFGKIFYDRKDYRYGSRINGEDFGSLERMVAKGQKYVFFASMQDLRGSETVGGKFDKNDRVFSTPWDFIIVDEAHEGTKTELGQNVLKELTKEKTKVLQLSGTPFNLFDDYAEADIYTWDYVMEQKAKQAWAVDNPYEPNPYASLPSINIYTYDLGNLMSEFVEDEKAFNFREFFRTKDDGTFVHDKDVERFLDLMCRDDKDSLYPYSNDEYRRIFRHTLWMVPGVKAAKALSAKLHAPAVFGLFKVVNVAGDGDEDEENAEALKMVEKAIGDNPDETYTITLSCGRLTTGVSVKPWTGVFMMAGSFSTSAAGYMQTIFRVQTPYSHNGRMKEQCYAFDFAPDRTLRVLAEAAKVSTKAGKQTDGDRQVLGDFLNFCPIISIEGSQMKPYDVKTMMGQLKKAQIEKVVQCAFEDGALYNDELLKLTDVELAAFQHLKGKIGATKAMAKSGDIDVNQQGFTKEEYAEKEKLEKKKKKDLTPEEKARLEELKKKKTQRAEAISILRGISIRMPLLIYGAELKNEEEELTIDNFTNLVDDVSWEEFMPKGVTKEDFENFKKYYEADVFREAGKRIREMARAADKFTIEERIERLATIFNTFRNPDKETVLTPWRVVNMHMSDCLGGWCFYDEEFKQMLNEPRYVDRGQVTKDVFKIDAHMLEINSKSGLYPLYVAYNIYRNRVAATQEKYGDVSHSMAMMLWDATIEENILVVCKTPMAKSITKRTLAGFRSTRVNAQYYKDLIKNISEKPTAVVNTFKDGKHFWKINNNENMKIDAVVGNPPYQVMDGGGAGTSAIPVYNKYWTIAKEMNPLYNSMVMPARWYSGGKGLDDFRISMLKDKRMKVLVDFPESRECFPSADIAGGICYILWDKKYNGDCLVTTISNGIRTTYSRDLSEYDTFVRQANAINILHKVTSKNEDTLNNYVYSRKPFGLDNQYTGKASPFNGSIVLFGSQGLSYIKPTEVLQNAEAIGKWKVIVSKASAQGGRADKEGKRKVLPKAEVLVPNSACTESYLLIACFDNEEEAKNALSYIKTLFFRFLLSLKVITQNIAKDSFAFIPLQDFSKPWTDEELYKKYNLSDEEIAFIESMIKPME
ncbi:MAG: Eco57I restriction-modification methylase domain-containing protein [Bacteroidaceae bacterium]|nr:Eco57I restriction-modification methylase domain-containing protein [Bacteroidaceae bacterium]